MRFNEWWCFNYGNYSAYSYRNKIILALLFSDARCVL